MGYAIYVVDQDESGDFSHADEIGFTFNYNDIYKPILNETIGDYLDGKTLASTKDTLSDLVNKLGTKEDPDGWAATPGNAGMAAQKLLDLVNKHPKGFWKVYR